MAQAAHAGNLYVNRNMVGAVVGVQPFGGEGLSGTGPKAGGPLYLLRLLARHPASAARAAIAATAAQAPDASAQAPLLAPLQSLADWAGRQGQAALAQACAALARSSCAGLVARLPGPTGERNDYRVLPRERVLCLADDDALRLLQLATVLAAGSQAVWPSSAAAQREALPPAVRERIVLAPDGHASGARPDAALYSGDAAGLSRLCATLADGTGPLVGVAALQDAHDAAQAVLRLLLERATSVNTTAAGGNASLMTMDSAG